MSLTPQQQAVISEISKDGPQLIKCSAVAGSGKTHTIVELAKTLNPSTGIYLAYNSAIAREATIKFRGTNVTCSTIHSLAYAATVKQFKLRVGYFGVRSVIGDKLSYGVRKKVHGYLEDFFLSSYVDVQLYYKAYNVTQYYQDICNTNLNGMFTSKIPCSHSFYLKLYHICLVNGTIPLPVTDLLLVDECADLTMLTIEIFKLINSLKKVAVGDPLQSIYSFNKTVNLFNMMSDIGTSVGLTQSFRVSDKIAALIEEFVRGTLDDTFQFQGRVYPDNTPILDRAYISRGNIALVSKMFDLMGTNTPFTTTRDIDTILELPLVLANMCRSVEIEEYQFKYLEKLRLAYYKSLALQRKHPTVLSYVASRIKEEDVETTKALKLVAIHGAPELLDLQEYVYACSLQHSDLTLTTAHSSKGLEWSSVTIADDLNDDVFKAATTIAKQRKRKYPDLVKLQAAEEVLRLYYVACSRAKIELLNANMLSLKIN